MTQENDTEGGADAEDRGDAGGGPAARFLAHLDFIHKAARRAARQRGLDTAEIEDFESELHLKLIANQYEVVRSFRDRSAFTTFLVSVIEHALLDHLDKRWGKWRASAVARRLGENAVLIERMVRGRGLSIDETVARLAASGTPMTRDQVLDIVAFLPVRVERRSAGESGLESLPSPHGDPATDLEESERQRTARMIEARLGAALARLPADDRLLLFLVFVRGFSIPEVAALWGGPARPLYTRFQKCKSALRRDLEASGLDRAAWQEFFGDGASRLREVGSLRRKPGDGRNGPSDSSEGEDGK